MKSLVSVLVMMIGGVLALGGGSPETPTPLADFSLQTADSLAALKCDNPLCDCQSCECVTCTCTPLEVGSPPDQVALVDIKAGAVAPVVEPKFTQPEPPPGLIVPVVHPAPKPVAKSPPVASGQWVTRYAGFRGRRSYLEWVPASAGVACSSGACASCR